MEKSTESPINILALPLHVRAEMAMKAAFKKLVAEHLRDDSPIYIWRDDHVATIAADELRGLSTYLSR